MYIEDLLIKLATSPVSVGNIDLKFIVSLYNQIIQKTNLTEKQRNLTVGLIKKYKSKLSQCLNQDISEFLDHPQYRYPVRTMNNQKTIHVLAHHDQYGKAIEVKFPYDEAIIQEIRQSRSELMGASWNDSTKSWIFALGEQNILFLSRLVDKYAFEPDQEFMNYCQQVKEIQKNIEKFVPMVIKDETGVHFINTYRDFSENLTDDLIECLFAARKLGIHTWDEAVEEELNMETHDPLVRKFLKTNYGDHFSIILEEKPLFSIKNLVKHLFPCLVIISDNNELKKLKDVMHLFDELNVNHENISVMFRLSNETDANFNQFVKENKLNSPLTENTKVVIINNNIPKTILEPRKFFNCVLNYNYYSAHYKMRNFLNSHSNVINILEKTNKGD